MVEHSKNLINRKTKLHGTLRLLSAVGSLSCIAAIVAFPSFAKVLGFVFFLLAWCTILSNDLFLKWDLKKLQEEYTDMFGEVKE